MTHPEPPWNYQRPPSPDAPVGVDDAVGWAQAARLAATHSRDARVCSVCGQSYGQLREVPCEAWEYWDARLRGMWEAAGRPVVALVGHPAAQTATRTPVARGSEVRWPVARPQA